MHELVSSSSVGLGLDVRQLVEHVDCYLELFLPAQLLNKLAVGVLGLDVLEDTGQATC